MTKNFSSTIVKRKGKGYNAVVPFEFDDASGGEPAIPTKIHLIPIGQWEHDLYGPIIINAADIREYQQNFNAEVRKGVFITAGHEGMMELPAVGWIKAVESRDTGLWGEVEWNELGIETLSDKQFKFFSPEMYRDYEDPQTHQFYRNVLTGGALTKSPYFKELEAVVFSDRNIKNNFNENKNMDLKKLLEKDITTLNDEEKAFIKTNKEQLTEDEKLKVTSIIDEPAEGGESEEDKAAKATAEAKATEDANIAAGLNADGTAKIEASEKNGMVMISASTLKILEAKANEGATAFAELKKAKLDSAVNALVFSETNKSGAFLPKSKDSLRAFMETLNDAQSAKFTELMKVLPKTQVFNELGVDNTTVEGTAKAEVDTKIEAKMKADSKLTYSEALKQVMSENKGLEQRYDEELPPVKGKK